MEKFDGRFNQEGGLYQDMSISENKEQMGGGSSLSPRSEIWKKKYLEMQAKCKELEKKNIKLEQKIKKLESRPL